MTATAHRTPPLVYIDCDVPDGLTLVEWRCQRHALDACRPGLSRTVRRLIGIGR
jgi:hypothetical protein